MRLDAPSRPRAMHGGENEVQLVQFLRRRDLDGLFESAVILVTIHGAVAQGVRSVLALLGVQVGLFQSGEGNQVVEPSRVFGVQLGNRLGSFDCGKARIGLQGFEFSINRLLFGRLMRPGERFDFFLFPVLVPRAQKRKLFFHGPYAFSGIALVRLVQIVLWLFLRVGFLPLLAFLLGARLPIFGSFYFLLNAVGVIRQVLEFEALCINLFRCRKLGGLGFRFCLLLRYGWIGQRFSGVSWFGGKARTHRSLYFRRLVMQFRGVFGQFGE